MAFDAFQLQRRDDGVAQVILDRPDVRERIGAAGRQRVIDQWSWRHTAERTVEHYRALLDEWRRPGS